MLLLLLQGTPQARSILITWDDNSENEEGFFVERTVSDDCIAGWELIAYTAINQNFLTDVLIPGACYRAAAYNEYGVSTYSDHIRTPPDL
jgi:hypothetical protein